MPTAPHLGASSIAHLLARISSLSRIAQTARHLAATSCAELIFRVRVAPRMMEGSSTDVDDVEAESEEAESEKIVGENAAVLSVVVFDVGVDPALE